jgi:hypothetical protein
MRQLGGRLRLSSIMEKGFGPSEPQLLLGWRRYEASMGILKLTVKEEVSSSLGPWELFLWSLGQGGLELA